jgi:hypothetical protein
MAVFSFIEGCYNPARRHSALGYLSPVAYELQMKNTMQRPNPQTVRRTRSTPTTFRRYAGSAWFAGRRTFQGLQNRA